MRPLDSGDKYESLRHMPRRTGDEVDGLHTGSPALGRELRQAARSLRRTPWYAGTIVAVVALSMALATTVFAVADGVLFKPLPYPHPDELYLVRGTFDRPPAGSSRLPTTFSPRELRTLRGATDRDVQVTSVSYFSLLLPDGMGVLAVAVDPDFFDVFGVHLLAGGFGADDYGAEASVRPTIISYRLWQRLFGGDQGALGQVLPPWHPGIGGPSHQIVGILPRDAFIPPMPERSVARESRIDLIVPNLPVGADSRQLVVYARGPDRQPESVQQVLRPLVQQFRDAEPPASPSPWRTPYDDVEVLSLTRLVSTYERPVLALSFGTVLSLVCLVLLNGGALAVARSHQRLRDLALRRALGARTRDLLRHALVEQSLLVVLGALIGVVAAPWILAFVLELLPRGVTLIKDVRIDWRAAAFAGFVSSSTAVFISLLSIRVPSSRSNLSEAVGDSAHGSSGRIGVGRWLVASQSAIAFILILGGGLFSTSLARVLMQDPGMRVDNVATMPVVFGDLGLGQGREVRSRALELMRQLRSLPELTSVSLFDAPAFRNFGPGSLFRQPADAVVRDMETASISVSSGFFDAASIELVAGRLPSDAELDTGAPVLAVSESLARAYWPNGTALGQVLRAWNVECTVVGVVRDIRLIALDQPPVSVIFSPVSLPISYPSGPKLYLTFDGDAARVLRTVRSQVSRLAPQALHSDMQLLEDSVSDSIRDRRLSAFAASTFGVVALVLVGVGLLGLVAMTASRRTREVGIRVALGARRSDVVRQLVSEQVGAVMLGLLAGCLLAVWAVRFIQAHLFETTAYDPAIWTTSILVLVGTAICGALIPALRASRVDPVRALRES